MSRVERDPVRVRNELGPWWGLFEMKQMGSNESGEKMKGGLY